MFMQRLLGLLLAAVIVGHHATASANDRVFTLKCQLRSTPPRNGGTTPDAPFVQHFHINLDAETVDGKKATITSTQIGWEPRQPEFLPYAFLSRADWHYHSFRQIGRVAYDLDGPCLVEK
jgi:hypothetical protein